MDQSILILWDRSMVNGFKCKKYKKTSLAPAISTKKQNRVKQQKKKLKKRKNTKSTKIKTLRPQLLVQNKLKIQKAKRYKKV